jgi:hypothetical protein
MSRAVIAAIALASVTGAAAADASEDPLTQLRTCSLMRPEDRVPCLDELARTVARQAQPTSTANAWIISQTRSPVDYAPIASATSSSREVVGGSPLQLSMRCRGGRSEFAIAGPTISGRGEDYVIFYSTRSAPPVRVEAATPAFGAGVALKVDPGAFFQSLRSDGELVLEIGGQGGATQRATFSLVGLDAVRAKIAPACNWPHAIANPNQ